MRVCNNVYYCWQAIDCEATVSETQGMEDSPGSAGSLQY